MAYSSILGGEVAPQEPKGRAAERLGPSDNSDSGSDTIGTYEQDDESTDAGGTGQRGAVAGPDTEPGADILPDRVVNLAEGKGFPEADPDSTELTDLDAEEPGLGDGASPDDER
jgi:hypothetical protein